jgi:hypothetical protein
MLLTEVDGVPLVATEAVLLILECLFSTAVEVVLLTTVEDVFFMPVQSGLPILEGLLITEEAVLLVEEEAVLLIIEGVVPRDS